MGWPRYATEVSDAEFVEVRRAFEDVLELTTAQLGDGVFDLEQLEGSIALAVDTATEFLAARVLTEGKCFELFYVRPATGPARMGYTASGADAEVPLKLHRWLRPEHRVDNLPSFTTLSTLLASQGASVRDVGLKERQLEAELDYLKQLLADQSDLLRQAHAQLRDARRRGAVGVVDEDLDESPPARNDWNLANLAEWCAEHEEEVVVLPRARNGAKKSRYEDPALIGEALDVLAGPYRDFRAGLLNREEFDALIAPTGLRLAGSVGATIAGEHGDAYFVPWAGRRRFLDFHLLKGGGRDERYCFRLYFFWDETSQRAVVGSMPAHLSNSLS